MADRPTTESAPPTASPAAAEDRTGAGSFASDASEQAALDVWADLLRVTETLQTRLADRLSGEQGIQPEEVELLMALSNAPEQRLRMADVSSSLVLSKSGVTRLVDRLEQRGLVERAACPSDRRVVYAGLTDEGRRVLGDAAPVFVAGVVEHLGRHLRPKQLARMQSALRAILAAESEA